MKYSTHFSYDGWSAGKTFPIHETQIANHIGSGTFRFANVIKDRRMVNTHFGILRSCFIP